MSTHSVIHHNFRIFDVSKLQRDITKTIFPRLIFMTLKNISLELTISSKTSPFHYLREKSETSHFREKISNLPIREKIETDGKV